MSHDRCEFYVNSSAMNIKVTSKCMEGVKCSGQPLFSWVSLSQRTLKTLKQHWSIVRMCSLDWQVKLMINVIKIFVGLSIVSVGEIQNGFDATLTAQHFLKAESWQTILRRAKSLPTRPANNANFCCCCGCYIALVLSFCRTKIEKLLIEYSSVMKFSVHKREQRSSINKLFHFELHLNVRPSAYWNADRLRGMGNRWGFPVLLM